MALMSPILQRQDSRKIFYRYWLIRNVLKSVCMCVWTNRMAQVGLPCH